MFYIGLLVPNSNNFYAIYSSNPSSGFLLGTLMRFLEILFSKFYIDFNIVITVVLYFHTHYWFIFSLIIFVEKSSYLTKKFINLLYSLNILSFSLLISLSNVVLLIVWLILWQRDSRTLPTTTTTTRPCKPRSFLLLGSARLVVVVGNG